MGIGTQIMGINTQNMPIGTRARYLRIWDIYFLSSEIHKWMKVLDIILKRIPTSIDHLMMKSFLLSLNAATTDESEFLLNKAWMLAKRVIDYSSIEVINQYLSSIKPPSHDLDDQTQQISKWIKIIN